MSEQYWIEQGKPSPGHGSNLNEYAKRVFIQICTYFLNMCDSAGLQKELGVKYNFILKLFEQVQTHKMISDLNFYIVYISYIWEDYHNNFFFFFFV